MGSWEAEDPSEEERGIEIEAVSAPSVPRWLGSWRSCEFRQPCSGCWMTDTRLLRWISRRPWLAPAGVYLTDGARPAALVVSGQLNVGRWLVPCNGGSEEKERILWNRDGGRLGGGRSSACSAARSWLVDGEMRKLKLTDDKFRHLLVRGSCIG